MESLSRSLASYVRRDVRRAEKRGYTIENDVSLVELDRSFYEEYSAHMHQLGTPVMGRSFMTAMREHLGPERLRLYLVRFASEIIGGLLCVLAPSGWTALYATVRESHALDYANHLLYWHTICEASREGAAELDLGRNTPGSGPHKFKQKWTGVDREAVHIYFSALGNAPRDLDEMYQGVSEKQKLWSKLPLPLANRLGPILRRDLPFG